MAQTQTGQAGTGIGARDDVSRPTLRISVTGPLSVVTSDGREVTPPGAKTQGLVALLALSPGLRRSRRWIEDKLWSDFGPEQASANLRQALTKLRAAFGPAADAVRADRTSVGFDPERVTVATRLPAGHAAPGRDLLEGIDVRDAEFEDWLRGERARHAAEIEASRPVRATGVLMSCRTEVHDSTLQALFGEILSNQIGESIAEQVRAWRRSGRHTGTHAGAAQEDPTSDLEIACDLLGGSDGARVYIRIVHLPSARMLYSKLQKLDDPQDILSSSPAISALVFEAADRALAMLPQAVDRARPEARATALSRLALYRMFSFEPASLREADDLLTQAHEADANGVYTAWRSLIRTIQMIELLEPDPQALREEMVELNRRALEEGPDNALVQALLSQVRVMALGDAAGGLDLARQSVDRNPTSAFGWLSLSVSRMLAGDQTEAIALSARAREIARFSPFRQWWDLYHCIVCVACNAPAAAIEAGEAAARAAPSFRPAHRHLLALYALEGRLDKAEETARRLARIEPGFTLDRFVNDDTYPVRTLRTKGLLEPVRALL
ncbi:transcriptional regulator [Roseivivax isoporae]|uniref:Transcriptional regulator n=1 Tax=Roseivivax isoporae LMG 25204 TaxID=1449351 RepID=X7FG77_9RHOB|nr:transcriptional regulator [Roseivivax isoporae]ETX30999.1 transcriptional regulator [Roseivivax isoporae LMG 25204]